MPDVTRLLEQDHRKVEELFAQFQESGEPSIARTICDELTIHTTVEEEAVYPRLRDIDREGAQEAQKEHDEAKRLIARIRNAGGGELSSLMQELQKAIEHHVEEEESEIFPEMRERLGTELELMGGRVQQRKQELMGGGEGRVAGRGDVTDFAEMTKDELYTAAKEAGIEGRSKMNKAQLTRALQRQR